MLYSFTSQHHSSSTLGRCVPPMQIHSSRCLDGRVCILGSHDRHGTRRQIACPIQDPSELTQYEIPADNVNITGITVFFNSLGSKISSRAISELTAFAADSLAVRLVQSRKLRGQRSLHEYEPPYRLNVGDRAQASKPVVPQSSGRGSTSENKCLQTTGCDCSRSSHDLG